MVAPHVVSPQGECESVFRRNHFSVYLLTFFQFLCARLPIARYWLCPIFSAPVSWGAPQSVHLCSPSSPAGSLGPLPVIPGPQSGHKSSRARFKIGCEGKNLLWRAARCTNRLDGVAVCLSRSKRHLYHSALPSWC